MVSFFPSLVLVAGYPRPQLGFFYLVWYFDSDASTTGWILHHLICSERRCFRSGFFSTYSKGTPFTLGSGFVPGYSLLQWNWFRRVSWGYVSCTIAGIACSTFAGLTKYLFWRQIYVVDWRRFSRSQISPRHRFTCRRPFSKTLFLQRNVAPPPKCFPKTLFEDTFPVAEVTPSDRITSQSTFFSEDDFLPRPRFEDKGSPLNFVMMWFFSCVSSRNLFRIFGIFQVDPTEFSTVFLVWPDELWAMSGLYCGRGGEFN